MIRGVLLDIDGVLTVSWRPLPGAPETIRWLAREHLGFRLVTNTSSRPRAEIAALLEASGMPVDPAQILTAVTSARRYLDDHFPGAACFVVNDGDLRGDLGGVVTDEPTEAEVVLLGAAGPSVGYAQVDTAFKLADRGVPVVALHRNLRYQTLAGPALDMGAFLVGIECAANIEAAIVGKPSAAFFNAALGDLGVNGADALMVGDDIVADVIGAQALGITGALVRTGKFRDSDLEDGLGRPDHVIDGIGQLPELLDRLGVA